MHRRSRLFATLVCCLWTALPAHAADVAIRYLVERDPLRTLTATAAVVVELHATAACDAAVASEAVALTDLQPIVDVTRLRLRGAPKRPRVVEIRHVVDGVPTVAAVYARVRGEGIVPIGDACQVQTFAAPPAVPWPLARDANGALIGAVAMLGEVNGVLTDDGRGIASGIGVGRFVFETLEFGVAFTTTDCSGSPYLPLLNHPHAAAAKVGGIVYAAAGPPTVAALRAFRGDDGCFDGDPYEQYAAPATALDLGRFVPPYVVDLAAPAPRPGKDRP